MGQSLRSLAVEAGVSVHECVHRRRGIGLKAAVGAQRPRVTTCNRAAGLGLGRHHSVGRLTGATAASSCSARTR